MAKVDFGEWFPDQPINENPGAIEAKNCIPSARSYRPFYSLSEFAGALNGACVGSYYARSSSEALYTFFASASKLYRLVSGTTVSDVSKTATTYSADFWDFVNFKDRIIATDGGAGNLQYYDMDTSTEFADLPGSPPRFKCLGIVGNFVVGGNYSIGSEVEPGGLAWCGFNNSELWTPSLATQSQRRRTRSEGAAVQRIVSGTVGLVFRELSIAPVRYIGPPVVFDTTEVLVRHGTPAPQSVAWTKQFVFYYSNEGFFRINRNDFSVDPIGVNKVNMWLLDNIAAGDIVNIKGAVDIRNNLVMWAFRSSTSAVTYDRIIVFDYANNRWSYAEINTEWLGEFAADAANLDTLDAVLGSGGIDINSINVDTDAYHGVAGNFMGFTPNHAAATFDGAPLIAEIDTTELGLEGRRSYVNGVRPIVEGASTVEVAPLTRDLPSASPVLGNFTGVTALTGQCDLRSDARYQRFRCRITGGFDKAQRLEYDIKRRGRQ